MNAFLAVSVLIFIYGIYALITKKNLIKSLIGIILMTESSHLLFISVSPLNSLAQYFVLISIVVAGCLIGTIISFILIVYKRKGTINTKVLNLRL
jgi:NADH:ubiquinone oxidoreductase subunit K